MSAIIRSQASRAFASASAVRTPAVARTLRARSMATIPDPQHPTDKPLPNDKPGSNNTFLYLVGGTALAIGGWWYTQQSGHEANPHDQRKADEERVKQKAAELRDASVATVHDVAKEGEKAYEDAKASAIGKLEQARAHASATVDATQSKLDSYKHSAQESYDEAKANVTTTYNEAARETRVAFEHAAEKVEEEKQSWGAWFGSWFGYGKRKAIAKGAEKVESGAEKVEKETQKRA
ncbi:hypothetical protein BDY19DRAFT_1064832 [Irpex rosettiformis]|uniref:Uncharacterized protein n=1 Tax=Irpex rosettiformis TaxID=378272 RepID=A0ACB8UGK8_9APHY|nr:hypothetical protein BDY19DRAFT_1064832 [Irpex rosettiformis]